jgi:hypothetical protein
MFKLFFYKCLTQNQFDEAYRLAERASRQIYGFMVYLKSQPNTRRVREEQIEYTFNS